MWAFEDNGEAAFDYFFGRDTKPSYVSNFNWNNHMYALNAIVCELISCASNKEFLGLMIERKKRQDNVLKCRNCKKDFVVDKDLCDWYLIEKNMRLPNKCE